MGSIPIRSTISGCGSLVDHLLWEQADAGSIPVIPTILNLLTGISSKDKIPADAGDRPMFDSSYPLHGSVA